MTYYPTDDECDAAQIASEEYIHGHRVSTNRDLGIVRGAMRAALIAAWEHRQKEKAVEIKIEDYLTDEEVKDIIAAEIRTQTRHAFDSKRLDPNTLLSNAGYYAVFDAVDEYVGENGYAQKHVEQETRRVLNGMSEHTVFSDRGNYPRYRPSVAQEIVDEATKANRAVIERQVAERLEDISDRIGGEKINKFVADVVRDALDSLGED